MNNYSKRITSFLLAFILIFSNLSGASVAFATENNNDTKPSNIEEKIYDKEKYSKELNEELKKEKDFYDVIVYFVEEASFEHAKMMSNMFETNESQELKQRKAVIGELKEVAYKSQSKLSDWLDEEKSKGNVKEYKNFFIVNAIHLVANRQVIDRVSLSPEVEMIDINETIKREDPIKPDEDQIPRAKPFRFGQKEYEWNIEAVGANLVWDRLNIRGQGVTVGILDSEVNVNHKALKNKFRGYDPQTGSFSYEGNYIDTIRHNSEPDEKRDQTHGTHVMGIILGSERDQEGKEFNQIGVAPDAKFITARVFDDDGYSSTDGFLTAAQWMLAPNGKTEDAPQIINNSWGDGRSDRKQWFKRAIESWRNANIVPVFASGNRLPGEGPPGPGSIASPANYEEAFAVGAIDRNNKLADFSKRGPSPFTKNIKPDLTAPGVIIRSSVGKGYIYMSGTSMAAPHVSGVAALVKSANPNLSVNQIEDILRNTADPLTDANYGQSPNHGYGHGRVNGYNAVNDALGTGNGRIEGKVAYQGQGVFAEVYIKETNRAVRTDSNNGSYVLIHPAGDYTLVAKAYGYDPIEKPITITKDGKFEQDFDLKLQPRGDLEISLKSQDGKALSSAFVRLIEDSNIEFVDQNNKIVGKDIPVGKYNLRLFKESYKLYEQEVEIKEGLNSLEITLEDLGPQQEVEIKYDTDNINRNVDQNLRIGALGYSGAGVKFIPTRTEGTINSISIRFGQRGGLYSGTKAVISIKERDNRGRVRNLLEPMEVDFQPNDWNTYSLEKYQIKTDNPYYVLVEQAQGSSFILGVDQAADADFSFIYDDNNFYSANNIFVYGGLMIRSNMTYPQGAGEIIYDVKAPSLDPIYPNEKKVNGKAEPNQGIQIVLENGLRLNDYANDKGEFSFTIRKALKAGEEVVAYGKDKNGVKSAPIRSLVLTDKTALDAIIKTAENYKDYKVGSEENSQLKSNVEEAKILLENIKQAELGTMDKANIIANQNQLDAKAKIIKDLVLALSPAKENLNREIQKAKENIDQVWISINGRDVPETKDWVTNRAWSTFNRAITSAMAVYGDVDADVSKIDRAIAQLKSASIVFDGAKQKGREKVLIIDQRYLDGRWEGEGRGHNLLANHIVITIKEGKIVNIEIKEWKDSKQSLEAIEKDGFLDRIVEENALDIRPVKGYEVESRSIIKAITQAIEKAIAEGYSPDTDKQPLVNVINRAKQAKKSLPESDGKGVDKDYEWTDALAHKDLDRAINNAEKSLADSSLTIDLRDKAIMELEIAIRNFQNTKRVGPVFVQDAKTYKDGIYTVEVHGHNKINKNKFKVEIANNKVVRIEIIHWADSPGYNDKIKDLLVGEKSGPNDVDIISHATNSSLSVRKAVEEAFKKAQVDEAQGLDKAQLIKNLKDKVFQAKKELYMTDVEGSPIQRNRQYAISLSDAQKLIGQTKYVEQELKDDKLQAEDIQKLFEKLSQDIERFKGDRKRK